VLERWRDWRNAFIFYAFNTEQNDKNILTLKKDRSVWRTRRLHQHNYEPKLQKKFNSVSPQSSAFFEKLFVAELHNKFSTIYGT
jgi:hypothetical protein